MAREAGETPLQRWRRRKAEFIDMTTVHGMKRAGEYEGRISSLRRYAWALFVALGFGAVIVLALDQMEEYRKHPTSTKMTVYYQEKPLQFPSVTVCSLNRFYNYGGENISQDTLDFIEDYNLAETAYSEDVQFSVLEKEILYASTSHLDFKKRNLTLHKYKQCDSSILKSRETAREVALLALFRIKCRRRRKNDSISIRTMLDRYGFNMEKSLRICKFGNGRERKCSADDFSPLYSTKYGLCWTFNSARRNRSLWKQSHNGLTAGLRLELKNPQENFIQKRLKESLSGVGLKITLHDPIEPPDVDESGFFVGPGFHSFAEIEMTKEQYVKPPWGKCVQGSAEYSRNTEEHRCRRNLSIASCGCAPSSYVDEATARMCGPSDLAFCMHKVKWSPDESVEATTQEWRRCKRPTACRTRKFKARISSLVWPSVPEIKAQEVLLNISKEKIKQDYAVINIYYPELKYYKIEEVTLIYFTNLLSKFGGITGLFLGASILTVLEIAELFLFYCVRYIESAKDSMLEWTRLTNARYSS